ncbi:MAG: AsmA-like C-terminal region-containing protein, partial [Planctomycetes bacterium]|nr:AsmA-like C-terminal region-containing protein [Planctomycetota bacterium]
MNIRPHPAAPDMLRRFRQLLVVVALVGLAGAVCALYLRGRVDEEIRAEVERRFRAHYPGLSVHVRSARWFDGQGIRIRGVSVVDPAGRHDHGELAYVEEIFAASKTPLSGVMMGDVLVEQLVLRGLKVNAVRREDGTWSATPLWPPPQFSETPPPVRIENAVAEIVDPAAGGAAPIILRDIHLDMTPAGDDSPAMQIRGAFSSDHFRRVELAAAIRESDGQWSCRGNVESLDLSPELWRSLPRTLTERLPAGTTIQGRSSFRFAAANQPAGEFPWRFVVAGEFQDGRIADPRLPYAITDFHGDLYYDCQQLRIDDARARCGPAALEISYHRQGFAPESVQTLRVVTREAPLDAKLFQSLPAGVPALWDQLQPSGVINADITLAFEHGAWRPQALVELLDVSFAHEKFPYRLHRGAGRVELAGDEVSLSVLAMASGQYVRLDGKFADPGPAMTGWLEFTSQGPIPLNDQLLAALNEKGRDVVAAFSPRGAATFWGRLEKADPRAEKFEKRFLVHLHNCSIKHEKFPYPIDKVQGTLELRDGRWEFRDLEGWNAGAHIACHGDWAPTGGGSRLAFHFTAEQVPLDDELRYALSPKAQELWTKLRPRGVVDQLKANVTFSTPQRELSLDVQAIRWPNQPQTVDRRPISIVPTWFPFRLDNVTGAVHFRDGEIELRGLHAEHGDSRFSAAGRVSTSRAGPWRLVLEQLTADRLHYDRDLAEALPPGLAGAVGRLSPTGPLSLRGWVEFAGSGRDGERPSSRWDVRCETVGGHLKAGVMLEDVHGGVRMVGQSDGTNFSSRGQLDIDSLFYKGVQLVQLEGPLYLDNTRAMFGAWTPAREGEPPPRPLTAQTLGGVMQADVRCSLAGEGEFAVQGTLIDGDLRTITRELTGQTKPLSGKVLTTLRLAGTSHGPHTWRGDGVVRLRDADVYQLPVMVSLLKVLRLQPPDTTAFTTSNIDYRIQGEHLYFDRIDFTGDAVSLWGAGEMSLERELKLRLFVQVGRSDSPIPLIGDLVAPVFREAGRGLLLIHVTGPLENPSLRTETFPGLNEMFEQMFPDAARNNARPTSSL